MSPRGGFFDGFPLTPDWQGFCSSTREQEPEEGLLEAVSLGKSARTAVVKGPLPLREEPKTYGSVGRGEFAWTRKTSLCWGRRWSPIWRSFRTSASRRPGS